MKKLLLILMIAFVAGSVSAVNVPDTFYQREGNTYVEYQCWDTGSGVNCQKTGYCAQSSSGTMRYSCDFQH